MTSATLLGTARAGAPASGRSGISIGQTLAFGVPAIAMPGPALFIQF